MLATTCAVLLAVHLVTLLRRRPAGLGTAAKGSRGGDIAANRKLGDVTTLADSSVMDLIRQKLPAAPAED